MTAANHISAHRARFAERGYRPAAGHCPMRVAGRRCTAWRYRDHPCICERHSHVLDHAYCWRDEDNQLVLTSEPYDAAGEEIADYAADLAGLGLRLSLTGNSPWYPGWTVLLTVHPERTA